MSGSLARPPNAARNATAAGGAGAVTIAAIMLAIHLVQPLTERSEALRHATYADPVLGWRVPTVCWGHTGQGAIRGRDYTTAECRDLLNVDMRAHGEAIAHCITTDVPPEILGSFVDYAFNAGTGWVPAGHDRAGHPVAAHILGSRPGESRRGFCNTDMVHQANAGHLAASCAAFTRYVYAGGHDCRIRSSNCRGVAVRRAQEQALCVSGLP